MCPPTLARMTGGSLFFRMEAAFSNSGFSLLQCPHLPGKIMYYLQESTVTSGMCHLRKYMISSLFYLNGRGKLLGCIRHTKMRSSAANIHIPNISKILPTLWHPFSQDSRGIPPTIHDICHLKHNKEYV